MRKTYLIKPAILIIALCIINIGGIGNTFAESFQTSEAVSFEFNPTISLSIAGGDLTINNLSPGSYSDSNIITVTASSNAINGYSVSSTVGNSTYDSTALNHSAISNSTFTSLTTNKTSLNAFDSNSSTWGYSYSADNGVSWKSGDITSTPLAGYNGLPIYTTESPIKLINANTNGSSSIQFKIGARATTDQAAGTYNNVINFISVANPNPDPPIYMQNATLADCGKTLYDRRDNSTYTTADIGGLCFMTQNLRISGTVSSQYSNFTGGNFNISSDSLLDDMYADDITVPRTATSDNPLYGTYYNYCAASAGTVCSGTIIADATSDICPSGWHLPTFDEYDYIYYYEALAYEQAHWNYEDDSQSGYYQSGNFYDDASRWWSATALELDTTRQYSADNYFGYFEISNIEKYSGLSIRCAMNSSE